MNIESDFILMLLYYTKYIIISLYYIKWHISKEFSTLYIHNMTFIVIPFPCKYHTKYSQTEHNVFLYQLNYNIIMFIPTFIYKNNNNKKTRGKTKKILHFHIIMSKK